MSKTQLPCYRCEQEKEPKLYYQINPRRYIDAKFVDQGNVAYKPICLDCVVPFVLERETSSYETCVICGCSKKISGCQRTITSQCTEVYVESKNYGHHGYHQPFDKTNYPNIRDGDTICHRCCDRCDGTKQKPPFPIKYVVVTEEPNEMKERCGVCHRTSDEDVYPKESDVRCWAIMIDKKRFTYGLNGSFQLLSEIGVSGGDKICNLCLKNIKFEETADVECDFCHKFYQSAFGGKKQGYGCAAWVHDDVIYGGYGSKYDFGSVKFTKERPSYLKFRSLICDQCINRLIVDGICQEHDDDEIGPCIPISSVLPTEDSMNQTETEKA